MIRGKHTTLLTLPTLNPQPLSFSVRGGGGCCPAIQLHFPNKNRSPKPHFTPSFNVNLRCFLSRLSLS